MSSSTSWRRAGVGHRQGEPSNDDRDRCLVLAHRSGDPDAFSVIFDRYSPQLLAQARRLLGASGGAEDACQETFRKALEGIGRFGRSGEWRIGAWLSTILHGVCVDQLAKAHRDRLLATVMLSGAGGEIDVLDQIPDPGELQAVKTAIGHLRPPLRRALLMRDLQGRSYAQVTGRRAHHRGVCTHPDVACPPDGATQARLLTPRRPDSTAPASTAIF